MLLVVGFSNQRVPLLKATPKFGRPTLNGSNFALLEVTKKITDPGMSVLCGSAEFRGWQFEFFIQ